MKIKTKYGSKILGKTNYFLLIYTKVKILFMKKIYLNFSHRYIYTVRLYLQLYPILSYPMIDIQYFQTYL